jgi:phosphoribosylamine---glycine ligase
VQLSNPPQAALESDAVKVLLVGSGGREHALAWKLAASPELDELHAAPGNPGIAALGHCHPVREEDAEGLLDLARALGVDLVVVGPEAPLVAGVADELRRLGFAVFGPSAAAARIEGSKTFAKGVMVAAGVPTADPLAVARAPCVIKVDGLAAGKGVFVCRDQADLDAGLRQASSFGGALLIEQLLEGDELSLFALADGRDVLALAPARDYKRLEDGDRGPNTGGMGSYSPVEGIDEDTVADLVDSVHRPVLAELARRGTPFTGLLYAGLMLTDDGPRVLEFNCRFGDPETQSILPRLDGDLLGALAAAAGGELRGVELDAGVDAAVTVVLAAGGYPERGGGGVPIGGIADAEAGGAHVFHAGTALRGDTVVASGGRVLGVTATGGSVDDARMRAYEAVEHITFEGVRYRRDVGRAVSGARG